MSTLTKKLKQSESGVQGWFHSLWEITKRYWKVIIGIIALIAFIVFIIAAYICNWDWAGFNGGHPKITTKGGIKESEQSPAKNLWDWLQLVIMPLVLAGVGLWFTQAQKSNEQTIASDTQKEAALETYINAMSELLLDKKLRKSQSKDEIQKVARVRTLTVLSRLDVQRKRSVLQFLFESGLIDGVKSIVDLSGADLSNVSLSNVSLNGAILTSAYLDGVHLDGGQLLKAYLDGAFLTDADLSKAYLDGANLRGADLSGADLSGAHLDEADLRGAILGDVILLEADLREANL